VQQFQPPQLQGPPTLPLSKSLIELKKLFDTYISKKNAVITVNRTRNPSCLSIQQQDTSDYLYICILNHISIPPSFKLSVTTTISCRDGTLVQNSRIQGPVATLNIPITDTNFRSQPPINMIAKLIEYTNKTSVPPLSDQPRKDQQICRNDIFENGLLKSETRQTNYKIKIPNSNIYILLSLIILHRDATDLTSKYRGKITIAPNFFINTGEFSDVNAGSGIEYKILGFTAHYGGWSGGHYVYYKKIADNSWVCISDNSATPMDETTALNMQNNRSSQCKDFLYIRADKYAAYFSTKREYNVFTNPTGTLCYMNSMNQLLFSMPEFVNYIRGELSTGAPALPPVASVASPASPARSILLTAPTSTNLSAYRITSDDITNLTITHKVNQINMYKLNRTYLRDEIINKKIIPIKDKLPRNYELDATKYDRIYVTSDIHADFRKFIQMMKLAKLINTTLDPYSAEITDPDMIGTVEWTGGEKALLVIVGDLVDGARQGGFAVLDPVGSFELLLHAFLYNLRISALRQNSDVRFTIGNHDFCTVILNDGTLSQIGENDYIHAEARTYFESIDIRAAALFPFYYLMPFYYLSITSEGKSQVEFIHAGLKPNHYTQAPYNHPDKDYTDDIKRFQNDILNSRVKLDEFQQIQSANLAINTGEIDGPLWGRHYAYTDECTPKPDGHTLIVVGHCPTNRVRRDYKRFDTLNKQSIYTGCGSDKHCVYTDCGGSLAFVDVASSAAMTTHPDQILEILYLEHTKTPDATDFTDGRYYQRMKRIVLDPSNGTNLKIDVQKGGARKTRKRSRVDVSAPKRKSLRSSRGTLAIDTIENQTEIL
jgi:hypothetical protein